MQRKNLKIDLFKNVERLAYTLMVLAVVLGIAGFMVKTFCYNSIWTGLVSDFYANVVTDLLSIGFGILVINKLYQRRNDEREKKMLVSQMGSPLNVLAVDAARIIRDRGWHKELDGISLWKANLEGAELYQFNLMGANLVYANLKDANLNAAILDEAMLDDANLEGAHLHKTFLRNTTIRVVKPDRLILKDAKFRGADLAGAKFLGIFGGIMTESEHPHLRVAYSLLGSIMPNGQRYGGRYNLQGDLMMAAYNHDIKDPSAMAEFYGVSLEDYQQGQAWQIQYAEYLATREARARSLCVEQGLDWSKMNPDQRERFIDIWYMEP